MVNVQPMGVCTATSSACVPAPIMWDGFEDRIFVGLFTPLLEDSLLPCTLGGTVKIFIPRQLPRPPVPKRNPIFGTPWAKRCWSSPRSP
ncbi:PAAR-like protein [Zobellia uliginosa]|uniref:PAAR-like protein n=1 Tax=Zobellia uliginosa TaxID=143224 RepID=UPI00373FC7A8